MIVPFVFSMLLYSTVRSSPTCLYISGQITRSAFTSCSESPLTVTTRSLSLKCTMPLRSVQPSNTSPAAISAALQSITRELFVSMSVRF